MSSGTDPYPSGVLGREIRTRFQFDPV
jgi:hypothetical protein